MTKQQKLDKLRGVTNCPLPLHIKLKIDASSCGGIGRRYFVTSWFRVNCF